MWINSADYDSGTNLTFPFLPDIGGQSVAKNYNNTIIESTGGTEYAYSTHDGKLSWSLTFSNIDSTFRTNLETFEVAVSGDGESFTFNDDSTTYTVRFTSPLVFSEVSVQRYSVTIDMLENS